MAGVPLWAMLAGSAGGSLMGGLANLFTGGQNRELARQLINEQIGTSRWFRDLAQRHEQEQAPLRAGLFQGVQGLFNRPVPQVQLPQPAPWNPYASLAPPGQAVTTYPAKTTWTPSPFQFKPGPPPPPFQATALPDLDKIYQDLRDRGLTETGENPNVFANPTGEGPNRVIVDAETGRLYNEIGQPIESGELPPRTQVGAGAEPTVSEFEAWPEYPAYLAASQEWLAKNPDKKSSEWPERQSWFDRFVAYRAKNEAGA